MPEIKLLTVTEAAKLLRVSPQALARWRMDKTGPAYTKAGSSANSRVLYLLEDLHSYLNSHRHPGARPEAGFKPAASITS